MSEKETYNPCSYVWQPTHFIVSFKLYRFSAFRIAMIESSLMFWARKVESILSFGGSGLGGRCLTGA
jgi:hypothetical protein